jgi:hypothetical protein
LLFQGPTSSKAVMSIKTWFTLPLSVSRSITRGTSLRGSHTRGIQTDTFTHYSTSELALWGDAVVYVEGGLRSQGRYFLLVGQVADVPRNIK